MTIVRKFETEEPKKYPKKLIGLCSFLLLSLFVAQIWANNTLANFGQKFETIQQKDQVLSLENQVLENKIDQLSSINKIASDSATLGLMTPKSIQYVQ